MILRDFLAISIQNLWRMKLRTALTVSGVVIGIGALVAMLSFGYGMQKNVAAQFRELDLFRTLHVMPLSAGGEEPASEDPVSEEPTLSDTSRAAPQILDEAALERFTAIDGVRMVYPQQGFEAQASWNDETHTAKVQALPASFGEQPMFREMVAGRFFAADTALEAVVSRRWLRTMEIDPDSIMGEWLSLKTAGGSELLLGVGRNQMEKMGFSRGLVEELSDVAAVFLSSLRPNTVVVKSWGSQRSNRGLASGWGAFWFRRARCRTSITSPSAIPLS